MQFLALDIGGANIKAADGLGYAASYPFALWQEPARLGQRLRVVISEARAGRSSGGDHDGRIGRLFREQSGRRSTNPAGGCRRVRQPTYAGLLERRAFGDVARGHRETAACGGVELACAGTFCRAIRAPPAAPCSIDVGSTTADVISLVDQQPVTRGVTDTARLLAGELVYTGVEPHSPVCALVDRVPYRGRNCPVTQELFATTLDVYLLLEQIAERPADHATADRRPATKRAARARLGRMIAADGEEFNHRDAVRMAEYIANAQIRLLATAVTQVVRQLPTPPTSYLFSGQGEFLAIKALEEFPPARQAIRLSDQLGPLVSRCAPRTPWRYCARGDGLMNNALRVVKVGGSLFTLADLPERLTAWLEPAGVHQRVDGRRRGDADVVRAWDERFKLGQERSHWLCIDLLDAAAKFCRPYCQAPKCVEPFRKETINPLQLAIRPCS